MTLLLFGVDGAWVVAVTKRKAHARALSISDYSVMGCFRRLGAVRLPLDDGVGCGGAQIQDRISAHGSRSGGTVA